MTESQNSPTDSNGDESWFCRDCEERLTIVYDERDEEETPVVCGSCGGTNTRKIVTDGGRDDAGVERCRCCDSPHPRTTHGDFIMGICRTCSDLIEGRMRRNRESFDEAIEHFEETGVLDQLRELRAEAEGRPVVNDRERSELTHREHGPLDGDGLLKNILADVRKKTLGWIFVGDQPDEMVEKRGERDVE